MAECVNWGQASLVDGSDVYQVTVLIPQSPEDTAAAGCGYGYLLTPAEMAQVQQVLSSSTGTPGTPPAGGSDLLSLSVEDGLILSGAIASLWCLAWVFRALRQVL